LLLGLSKVRRSPDGWKHDDHMNNAPLSPAASIRSAMAQADWQSARDRAAKWAAAEPNTAEGHFLLGLAAQAGQLMAGQDLPEGTTPEQALSGARSVIAILEMLKDKTEGRRTAQEDAIVAELLFELRMAYVERTRAGKA